MKLASSVLQLYSLVLLLALTRFNWAGALEMFGRAALRSGLVSKDGNSRYLAFLMGGTTAHGRTFEDILRYSDEELENDHEFIQWIFPLPEPSSANRDAPLVDITFTLKNPVAQEKIRLSYEKLSEFWGVGKTVQPERMSKLNGHNGLRFSRALQALVYHNQAELAENMLTKVLQNSDALSPSMHGPDQTVWEYLFQKAKYRVKELEESLKPSPPESKEP